MKISDESIEVALNRYTPAMGAATCPVHSTLKGMGSGAIW